jgi:hypothetical protein
VTIPNAGLNRNRRTARIGFVLESDYGVHKAGGRFFGMTPRIILAAALALSLAGCTAPPQVDGSSLPATTRDLPSEVAEPEATQSVTTAGAVGNETVPPAQTTQNWTGEAMLNVTSATTPVFSLHGMGSTSCLDILVPMGHAILNVKFEWESSSPATDGVYARVTQVINGSLIVLIDGEGTSGFMIPVPPSESSANYTVDVRNSEILPDVGASYEHPVRAIVNIVGPPGEAPRIVPVACWWF